VKLVNVFTLGRSTHCLLASSGFLCGLLFNPEDGGYMYLRNVRVSQNYTMLQPRRLAPCIMLYLFDPECVNETNFGTRFAVGVIIVSRVGGVRDL
jgi:hypothetical protein